MLMRTLVIRGLKTVKGPLLGMAILVALASAVLSFAICMYADLSARESQALIEVNSGDVVVSGSPLELTDVFVDEVDRLDTVAHVKKQEAFKASTSYRSADGVQIGEDGATNITYLSWDEAIDFNVFAEDGRALAAHADVSGPERGQVYVPFGMQTALGLTLGDKVQVSIGDKSYSLALAAFVEDPQAGSPFIEVGQYLLNQDDFFQMYQEVAASAQRVMHPDSEQTTGFGWSSPWRTLNIYMTDKARASGLTSPEFLDEIYGGTDTDDITATFFSLEKMSGYTMLVIGIFCAIFMVFALLLYGIALVICVHTIGSTIREGYADFAILKAVGVPNRTLRISMVMQYAGCALLGVLAGVVAGCACIPVALPLFARLTGLLAQSLGVPWAVWGALAALIMSMVFAVIVQTRAITRITPLVALRSGIGDVHFSHIASMPVAGRPLSLRIAWRAITSCKRNYAGLFVCALVLGAFVMFTFGIANSMKTLDDAYDSFSAWRSDISVAFSDDVDARQIEDAVSEVAPIEHIWRESAASVNIDGEGSSLIGLSDFAVVTGIAEGRAPEYDNEVAIGYAVAAQAGLAVGDELTLRDAAGADRTYIVTGLVSALINSGYVVLMPYESFRSFVGMEEEGRSLQFILQDGSRADDVRAELERRFGDAVSTDNTGLFSTAAKSMELIHRMLLFVGYAMDVIAVVVAVVAVRLIVGRMFAAERRDLCIYRALGFPSRSLRMQFALRFFVVALLGCTVAAATVMMGGSWLVSQLFATFGVARYSIDASLGLMAALAVAISFVFCAAAFWASCRVRRLSLGILLAE